VREHDSQYEEVDPRRHIEYRDKREFDRIAFAMRALRRLRPKKMTVAVYSAVSSLRTESWIDLRRGHEGRATAIVGIPPHASREHIAYALVELVGASPVPLAVQMLLADTGPD
jgi:hypothetical protein